MTFPGRTSPTLAAVVENENRVVDFRQVALLCITNLTKIDYYYMRLRRHGVETSKTSFKFVQALKMWTVRGSGPVFWPPRVYERNKQD